MMMPEMSEEKRLEQISRSNVDTDIILPLTNTTDDSKFYGFQGLDYMNFHLYRVLSQDEIVDTCIKCKDPSSTRTVEEHIASGSRNPSKYISTTSEKEVAALWAYYEMETKERQLRDTPLRVVEIGIQVLAGTDTEKGCINLCNKDVLEHFIKGATHRSWAKSSKEVLFQKSIPKFVTETDKSDSAFDSEYKLNANVSYYAKSCSSSSASGICLSGSDSEYEENPVYYILKDLNKPEPPQPKK